MVQTYEGLTVNEKHLFTVGVVSTMSSGKSTLINALAGRELLPAFNRACTAKMLCLLDNDSCEFPTAHIVYQDHTYQHVKPCTKEIICRFNEDKGKPISDIVVECNIAGVHNTHTALMLVDTPGVNNDLDAEHRAATAQFLSELKEGMLLYVLNAAQLATYDDRHFLENVYQRVQENEKIKVIFVLNKTDEIDPERESLPEMIARMARYIEQVGFENFIIQPVSAQAALLFKRALARDTFSADEEDDLFLQFQRYTKGDDNKRDCRSFVWDSKVERQPEVVVGEKSYSAKQLQHALRRTGIPALEQFIETSLLEATIRHAPWVKRVKEL